MRRGQAPAGDLLPLGHSPMSAQGSAGGPRDILLVDVALASDLRCGDDRTHATNPHATPL
jgi:hypothetical protein